MIYITFYIGNEAFVTFFMKCLINGENMPVKDYYKKAIAIGIIRRP